jgi:hypothetical protein
MLYTIIAQFVFLRCILGELHKKYKLIFITINATAVMLVMKLFINVRRFLWNVPALCPISQKFRPAVTGLFHADSRVVRRTEKRTDDMKLPVAFPDFAKAFTELKQVLLETVLSVM